MVSQVSRSICSAMLALAAVAVAALPSGAADRRDSTASRLAREEAHISQVITDARVRSGLVTWRTLVLNGAPQDGVGAIDGLFVTIDRGRTRRDKVAAAFAAHCARVGRGGAHFSADLPGLKPKTAQKLLSGETVFFLKCDR